MGISSEALATTFCCSVFSVFCCFSLFGSATNNITQGQSVKDGETIVSAGEKFVLGFFSPENSSNRYVGIWYYKVSVPSVVWVANRENPISSGDGVLKLGNNGTLMVLDGDGEQVWSSNGSNVSKNVTAILMDTGNLVISSSDSIGDIDKAFWESFKNPTDTFLPDMKVYMNIKDGESRHFTSWKSANDPSPGQYSMGVDPRGSPQIVMWEGLNRRWRSGHWNGILFIGVPSMRTIYLYGFKLFNEGNDSLYFTYTPSNSSDLIRFLIGWDGTEQQLRWNESKNEWSLIQLQPSDQCEDYNKCGSFGKCSVMNSPICSCIEGFEPKYLDQWNRGNWSGGCIRRTPLKCGTNSRTAVVGDGEEDGFKRIERVKLPDFADLMDAANVENCEEKCLKNCSCHAYAHVSGINCMIWGGDLIDIQQFVEGGNNLYVRLANSELGKVNFICSFPSITFLISGFCVA